MLQSEMLWLIIEKTKKKKKMAWLRRERVGERLVAQVGQCSHSRLSRGDRKRWFL